MIRPETAEAALDELAVDCGGKCDGLDGVRSLLRDPSELELDDLLRLGTGLANDELNNALSTNAVTVRIEGAEFHDADAVDALVTGLAAAYGEDELSTQVNALRLDVLDDTSAKAYAEMSVRIAPELAADWGGTVPGFDDANQRVGFSAGAELEVGVVVPVDETDQEDPFARLRTLRDFAVPRSLKDVRRMAPGEVFSIHGGGNLGGNFGVGVPILVATPAAGVTYTVVLSAGMRTVLSGDLDVQLVRLDGGDVVVDVGMSKIHEKSARLAVEDGWGVQKLLETHIGEVEGVDGLLNLNELVDSALTKVLDRRLNLLSAHAERTKTTSRMSVARLRIDLDAADPEVAESAISQAMRGDVRFAQALSARGEPGVAVEFDLLRSGISTTAGAGVSLFGLDFFRKTVTETGSVVIQTPGGALSLLYNSLHREKKNFFQPRVGFTRVALAGLLFDGDGPPQGEANLFAEIEERDGSLARDRLVDHLDGIIFGVGGEAALAAADKSGNALERLVRKECKSARVFEDCPFEMLEDERALTLRAEGREAVETAIADLPAPLQALVRDATELRFKAQATNELASGGPGTRIVSDVRLHDAALTRLLTRKTGADFSAAAKQYLHAAMVDRHLEGDPLTKRTKEVDDKIKAPLGNAQQLFDEIAAQYGKLAEVEEADLDTVGLIGSNAIEIRFDVDRDRQPIYTEATARSIAQARADLARELFDGLRERTKGLSVPPQQTVTYTLLKLTEPDDTDVRLDIKMDLRDTALHWREPFRVAGYPEALDVHASGPAVQPIDAGLFDIDALIQ